MTAIKFIGWFFVIMLLGTFGALAGLALVYALLFGTGVTG